MYAMTSPTSVRFDPGVLDRINAFVATHPGLSVSSASNLLIDEALREYEHPLITLRDGPNGRRARLVAGPDVWEVIAAVQSARDAEPDMSGDEVIALVNETSGVAISLIRAALAYWADYREEINALIEQNERAALQARRRWEHERELLDK
jgi:hypothetical protein